MPELPEVETMRRGVAAVAGSQVVAVEMPRSRLRPIPIQPPFTRWRGRVVGRRIVEVGRAGKRLVLVLDSEDRIVLEPRMTGCVLIGQPPDEEHVRLVFQLAGGAYPRLVFWSLRGLGSAQLLAPGRFAQAFGPGRLGPDALEITPRELGQRLSATSRAVKVALMDQRVVAGIGNLYASEILHRACIHPKTPGHLLGPHHVARLHQAMVDVLREAIAWQGSTLADGQYRDPFNQSGRFQFRHRVYQRAGERCVQCGRGRIRRIVQAQRSTFYCPVCQRLRKNTGRRS